MKLDFWKSGTVEREYTVEYVEPVNESTVFTRIVVPTRIIAPPPPPQVMNKCFPSPPGIALFIVIVHHINYWFARIIWFSEIFIFSKIDRIFFGKIALEINDRPGYYSNKYGILLNKCDFWMRIYIQLNMWECWMRLTVEYVGLLNENILFIWNFMTFPNFVILWYTRPYFQYIILNLKRMTG